MNGFGIREISEGLKGGLGMTKARNLLQTRHRAYLATKRLLTSVLKIGLSVDLVYPQEHILKAIICIKIRENEFLLVSPVKFDQITMQILD